MNGSTVRLILVAALLALPGTLAAKKNSQPKDALSELRAAPDERTGELNALKAEVMIANSEEKAIQQVQKLLKRYRGSSLEPDLLLRLAELYMRRAKTDRFLELHRKSEVVVAFAPKLVRSAASKRHIVKALELYDDIQRRYPRFDRIDVVVFNNAFANQQIGRDKRAENLYSDLVKRYTGSPLVPDAHLALGELKFMRRDFKTALKHFQAIRKFPDAHVYPYGLYKAAWTYYNLRDAASGLKELEDVIRYGKFVAEQKIEARLDLRKEALFDMALFYEDVHPASQAFKYFEEQAGDLDVAPVILKLSALYKRHSRHNDVRTILTDFVKRRPTSDYVPKSYLELADASDKLKKYRDVITLMGSLLETCEPRGRWASAQPADLTVNKESPLLDWVEEGEKNATAASICDRMFKKNTLTYAHRWLKIWNKDKKNVELADMTEKAYELYLRRDDKTDTDNRPRFVYAEFLFNRNKFRPASEQYAITGQQAQNATLAHDSRYFALISLEKAVGTKWSDADEKRFRELGTDYVKHHANGKFALDVEFKMALIAYEKGRYAEAAPVFLRLGKTHTDKEKGLRAQDLYLDILNLQKDYTKLRDYARSLRETTKEKSRQAKLSKIYEESYFLIVQQDEQKGRLAEAVAGYNAFAKENPSSPLAQKSLWNAIQLQFKTGALADGAKAAVTYYEKYPKEKESLDALIKAAQTYESMGQLKLAAEVVERLAKVDKPEKNAKEKKNWDLVAADFYFLDHAFHKAKPLYQRILKDGSREQKLRALEQLEAIARENKSTSEREKLLTEIAQLGQEPQASDAQVYFVEKAYQAKRYDEAFSLAKKVIAREKHGAGREALARARIVQARILNAEYLKQSVKAKLARVEMVLQMKTEKLSKAQIAYQSAASYGDPKITVEAYKELADSYLHYSEALRDMPVPEGLPAEEADAFRAEMEKLAMPMEERGVETKLQALSAAKQFHSQLVGDLQREVSAMNQQVVEDTAPRVQAPLLVLPRLEGVGS